MKYHILVNPAAKSGQGKKIWQRIAPVLEERGIDHEVVFSKSGAHIAEVVRKLTAHEGIRLIVLGGDGTLGQTVDAISNFSHVRLGYIPAGSGNDFARDLGLSADPLTLLDTILKDEVVRRMDVGTLTYCDDASAHKFVVSSDIGFGAAVCEGVDRSTLKKVLGHIGLASLSYLFIALRIIFGAKKPACTLLFDGEKEVTLDTTMMAAAMIHRYEGGGFMFAPDADPSDGLFDLCIVGDVTIPTFLRALPMAMKGKHFALDGFTHYRARTLEVRAASPLWLHTDGEVTRTADHVKFTCEKQLLEMLN